MVKKSEVLTQVEIEYEALPENPDICFYRRKTTKNIDGAECAPCFSNGFALTKTIENTNADKNISQLVGEHEVCVAVPNDAFERFQKGELDFHDLSEIIQEFEEKFFNKFVSLADLRAKAVLVLQRHYTNDILDLTFVPYSKLMWFGYIEGIHNGQYRLRDLRKELLKDPEHFKKVSEIKAIPYYNSEEGRDRCFDFYFFPNREEYAKKIYGLSAFDRIKAIEKLHGWDAFKKKNPIY